MGTAEPREEGPEGPGAVARTATQPGFSEAAVLGAVSSAITLGLTLLRSKVTAVVLGPSGMGAAAEVIQYASLAVTLATVASGPALSSGLAQARARGDLATARRIYSTALNALLLLTVLGGLCCSLVSGVLQGPSLGGRAWLYGLLSALGLFGGQAMALPGLVLAAHGEVRATLRTGLVAGVLPALLTLLLIQRWGLTGQFLALGLTPFLSLAVMPPMARRALPHFPWRPSGVLDVGFLRSALGVGAANLASGLLGQAVLVLVRTLLDRQGGDAAVGQFQAAWAVGNTYLSVVLGGLATFAFPRYAAADTPGRLAAEVEEAGRFVLRFAPPIVLLAIAFCDVLMAALYSGRFAPAAVLLGWQFVGDLPKGLSWVMGGPLLYRGKVRAFLAAELLHAGVFATGVLVLVPRWGLEGVGLAYALAYGVFLFFVRAMLSRACGVWSSPRQLVQLLGLVLVATGLVLAERRWPIVRALTVVVVGVWWWRSGVVHALAARAQALLGRLRRRPALR